VWQQIINGQFTEASKQSRIKITFNLILKYCIYFYLDFYTRRLEIPDWLLDLNFDLTLELPMTNINILFLSFARK